MRRPLIFLLPVLLTCITLFADAQVKLSVRFKSNEFSIQQQYVPLLKQIASQLKDEHNYFLRIEGHTDITGSESLNRDLGMMRAMAVRKFLIDAGLPQSAIIAEGFAAERPIADNATEEGKRLNRRADIIMVLNNPDTTTTYTGETIAALYRQLEPPPQIFCINPFRDTVLRCAQGTVIYIKANSLQPVSDCDRACVSFVVKEAYLRSDMVMMNLSTTSNGEIIETQGMIFTDAYDCSGKQLDLEKGKDLVILIPTDTVIAGAKIFEGARGHDSVMNWTVNNNSILSSFTIQELEWCGLWCIVDRLPMYCDPCRFGCQIKRVGNSFVGLFNKKVREENRRFNECRRTLRRALDSGRMISRNPTIIDNRPPIDPALRPKCENLAALFKKYGVNSIEALMVAVNKPLLDSFGVETIEQLQDTLDKVVKARIELSYMNKKVSYEDFKYYVYNTSQLGWTNVDVFANIPREQMVTLKTNVPQAGNIDCKLVFRQRRFVIPAETDGQYLVFRDVPKGEMAILVAVKYENGVPFLAMKEVMVEGKRFEMEFRQLTFEQLKEQLRKLD